MNNSITEFFDWYVLQDNPIQGLQFDFQEQTIRLLLENYDDISHCFVEQTLIFKGVSVFTFSYPSDEFLFDLRAIYRTKLEKIAENYYELALKIDMPEIMLREGKHHEFTVGKMLIGFADLEVIGGLSREAMEYKWKVEE